MVNETPGGHRWGFLVGLRQLHIEGTDFCARRVSNELVGGVHYFPNKVKRYFILKDFNTSEDLDHLLS